MKRPLSVCLMMVLTSGAYAELQEVSDSELSMVRGQASVASDFKLHPGLEAQATQGQNQNVSAQPLSSQTEPRSAGITIDIDLQLRIDEIRWVDTDGVGAHGTQGAVVVKGLSVGHLDNPSIPAPASIRGVTVDADGRNGFVMDLGRIGDTQGNGIDVHIDAFQIR